MAEYKYAVYLLQKKDSPVIKAKNMELIQHLEDIYSLCQLKQMGSQALKYGGVFNGQK